MKNKLFNKFLSVLLVSFIGLTSISSFNHVSASEFDSSYNNQLVSTANNLNRDLWGYPQLPSPNDPKLKPFWMGAVAYLVAMFSVKVNSPSNHTFNVLQNGLSDNSTSIFINNTLNNSPNFNMNDFANDPDVINGNFDSVYNKYSSKVNVDKTGFINLENHNKNLYYDGGNKNYYTNNDYSSVNNYQVYNNTTNHINYTYNNQHYNYTTNNYYYNYTNNTYIYNIANNQNISISNTYNNTTIISPSGATQKLYYELPDGSNSLNLTEEQAKKGFKTSLNVASYSNGYDDDNLNFLFHFDGNEYDSAYPIVNYNLKAIPNSVDYIDSSNPSFNQALAFSDSFDLSVEGSNYNNYYSFRIYPHISDNWSLNINGVNIGSVTSKYDTTSNYEEYNSYSFVNSTYLYEIPMKDNYKMLFTKNINDIRFVIVPGDFSFSSFSYIFGLCPSVISGGSYPKLLNSNLPVSDFGFTFDGYVDGSTSFYLTKNSDSVYPWYNPTTNSFYNDWSLYRIISSGYLTPNPLYSAYNGFYSYNKQPIKRYINRSLASTSNFRQYNFINNKTFLQTGTNLLNYNQWNFISIDISGKVFINGVDTNITVPLDQFKISVTGDSLTYIDELASFKSNRSNTSPSIPYDSNVSYYLPPVYYEDVYTPVELGNGYYRANYFTDKECVYFPLSFNSISFDFSAYIFKEDIDFVRSNAYSFIFSIGSNRASFFSHLDKKFIFRANSLSSNNNVSYNSFSYIDDKFKLNNVPFDFDYDISSSGFELVYGIGAYLRSSFNLTIDSETYFFYPAISSNGEYGFYDSLHDFFVKTKMTSTQYFDVKNVKKSDVKNNMLLIQSLIDINNSKFGGIRPSNPSTGDVYCSVNENGNITSVQQYNGIEWFKVVGSIYNDALGLWVNAVGFNIFLDNWSYQDIDYRADNPDTNILIRFLTSQFNKVTSLLDSIIEKIKGISSEDTVINNYQNNYNVDINTNIDNLINTSKDYDKDIDLNSPNYNVDDSILTDINNLAVGSKGIFKALDDSGFSILYLAPLILLLVGLLL